MDAKLWVNFQQQMDMIRHHFQFYQIKMKFQVNLPYECFEPVFNLTDKNFAPILWAPDYVILAAIYDVVVAFVGHPSYYEDACAKCKPLVGGRRAPPYPHS